MPNTPRRPDNDPQQEWATDASQEGKKSGNLSLEVVFPEDNPDGQWTTHVFPDDDTTKRLNSGQNTAIVIQGLSREREREVTALIHQSITETRGTQRSRILRVLGSDDKLKWAA